MRCGAGAVVDQRYRQIFEFRGDRISRVRMAPL
jgi:hypothetical protein